MYSTTAFMSGSASLASDRPHDFVGARSVRVGLEPSQQQVGILAREARILRGNSVAAGAVAAGACRHAQSPCCPRARSSVRSRRAPCRAPRNARASASRSTSPTLCMSSGERVAAMAVMMGFDACPRLERGELLGDVAGVLSREVRLRGRRAHAVRAVAGGAYSRGDLLAPLQVGLGFRSRRGGGDACVD